MCTYHKDRVGTYIYDMMILVTVRDTQYNENWCGGTSGRGTGVLLLWQVPSKLLAKSGEALSASSVNYLSTLHAVMMWLRKQLAANLLANLLERGMRKDFVNRRWLLLTSICYVALCGWVVSWFLQVCSMKRGVSRNEQVTILLSKLAQKAQNVYTKQKKFSKIK